MKRFLSIILTAAMLVSATPAVFAEDGADVENAVVAEELTLENQEEIAEDVSEEIPDEEEINAEEEAPAEIDEPVKEAPAETEETVIDEVNAVSEENDISLMAASDYNASDYKQKDTSTVMACSGDYNCGGYVDFYFDDLEQARQFILASSKDTGEKQITFLKDITLNSTYDFKDYKMKFLVKSGANITVSVNFLTSENSMLDTIFQVDGGCIAFLNTSGNAQSLTFKDITNYDSVNQSPKSFVTIKNGIEPSDRSSAVIGANDKATLEFQNFGCTNGVFNIEDSRQAFGYVKISGTRNGYPDVVIKGTSTQIDSGNDIPVFCLADRNSSLSTSSIFSCSKNYNIITREDLYPGSTKETNDVLVTGTRVTSFVDKFIYTAYDAAGNPKKKGVLAGTDSLVVTSAPTYTVTVVNPTSIDTNKKQLANLILKKDGTTVTSASAGDVITIEKQDMYVSKDSPYITTTPGTPTAARRYNMDFVKLVVTDESGNSIAVNSDNTFTMPASNVKVTAEYTVYPVLYVNQKGQSDTRAYKIDAERWNENSGMVSYDIKVDSNIIGTVTVSGQLRKYAQAYPYASYYSGTYEGEDGLAYSSYYVTAKDGGTFDVTVDITDKKYFCNDITMNADYADDNKNCKTISRYSAETKTAKFEVLTEDGNSIEYGTYTPQLQIWLDIQKASFNITTAYDSSKGDVGIYGYWSNKIQKASASDYIYAEVTPKENYKIKSFKVSDESITPTPYYSSSDSTKIIGYGFTMPASDVTVSVEFELDACGITIDPCEYGTVTTDPASSASVGSEVIITATPEQDYELGTLTVTTASGTTVDVTDSKFTMPSESVTIKATFAKKKFTVTDSSTTNGKISLLTDSPLNWGENFTINVQADPHYEIDTVTVDGKAVSVNKQGDYTFEMPTHDVTVSATFKKKAYNITINGEHFTVVENPGKSVWGETVTIKLNAEQWYNYDIFTVTPNTVLTGGNGTWVFTMPQSDITIDVKMVRPNFNVEFVSNGGSSVDGQVIANGNTVTKPSTPTYVNHGFAGWYTSPTFEADTKYDFSTNVTGDVKLYARWFLWGDVNGDGKVTPFDAVQLDRCYVGSINVESLVVPMAARVTDANKTKPTPFDSVQIKRKYVGSLDRFPVEKTSYEYDLENNKVITE